MDFVTALVFMVLYLVAFSFGAADPLAASVAYVLLTLVFAMLRPRGTLAWLVVFTGTFAALLTKNFFSMHVGVAMLICAVMTSAIMATYWNQKKWQRAILFPAALSLACLVYALAMFVAREVWVWKGQVVLAPPPLLL